MEQKKRPTVKNPEVSKPMVFGEKATEETVSPGVLVRHGLHDGTFPIRGKTVEQVRATLSKMLNIGANARAVINGSIVDPEDEGDTVIDNEVTMVNFVAESSVKGAGRDNVVMYEEDDKTYWTLTDDTLVCTGGRVYHAGICKQTNGLDNSAPLGTVLRKCSEHAIQGLQDQPLPSSTRWHVKRRNVDVFILEFDPCVRNLNWSDTGEESDYTRRMLAFPYLIMKTTFKDGRITRDNELFCRALPVRDVQNGVCFAPLLNVSPYAYDCYAWFCTQYLRKEKHDGTIIGQLHALITHLWGGGFNRSSEHNEGQSSYGLLQKEGFDARITDVAAWEQQTKHDPRFVHDVDWRPVYETPRGKKPVTIKSLIDYTLKRHCGTKTDTDEECQALLRNSVIGG